MVLSPTAGAATWYLQANQTTNWNTLSIWWSQPISGGTNPTSISASDDFDLGGYQVLTPNSTGVNTFGGAHLIFHGGGSGFLDGKTNETNSLVIPNLTSYGGYILNAQGSGNLSFSVTNFVNNANTTLNGGISSRGLAFTITTLTGSGDISAIGGGSGSAGGAVVLNVTHATGFTGTLYINNGCQFTFANAMTSGGALDVGGPGTAVTLNSTVTFKGVTVNGVAQAAGTYTAASLGFSGTGSVIVQAPVAVTEPVTQSFGTNLPGGSFSTPFYPTDALDWTYLQSKNLNLVRVAFKWEQVQPTLNGPLSTSVLASLDSAVALAASRGMQVFLDMHNYDRYNISGTSYIVGSTQVPYSAYQNAWMQLAAHFKNEAGIYGYDIMNEPHDDSGTWVSSAAQYGVNGVRQSDTTHYVIVEGDSYAGAQSWMSVSQNLNVTDPSNKVLYSAHTYWDSNNSGTYTSTSFDTNNCYPNVGVDRVAPFLYWLQLKGYKGGIIGEFGVPNNVASPDYRWNVALDNFLNILNANGVTGTYWSMSQNGWPDSYALLCATGGKAPGPVKDAPAMSVLETYGGGLIMPWASANVGSVSPATDGTASYASSVYTLNTGSGTELDGTATSDAFTTIYQPVSGDCTITARVASLSGNDTAKGEGGVIIRNDLTATAASSTIGVTTGRGIVFTYRPTAGAANVLAYGSNVLAPYWVRMVRSGSTFTAYESADNSTWTQVGTAQTITMGTTAYVGLPICNHGGTATATFDNVSITSP
jgi:endoglucanase